MEHYTENGTLYGFFTETRFAPSQRRPVKRQVMLIPGQGCVPWLKTKGECCTFCRLPAGTRFAVLGDGHEDHFRPWRVPQSDYVEMIETALSEAGDVENITVFNGGSFLTDHEIPPEVRKHIYRRFAEHPTASELMVESRPEFVRDDVLDEALRVISEKKLMVGIGLESIDDHIRNNVLKKYIGRTSFLAAIKRLQHRGARTFVYAFLGAPGLSEREAYHDAQQTIQFLVNLGVDEIALSCAFVPPGGHLEKLYRRDAFRPPWLWTIIELMAEARQHSWPLSVGGFDDFPPPVAIAQNCGRCDPQVMNVIDAYRSSGNLPLSALPQCGCRSEWGSSMEEAGSDQKMLQAPTIA